MTFLKLSSPVLHDVYDLLSRLALFQNQPRTAIDRLLEQASICRLAEGETLFRQSQKADHWFLVLEGRMDTLRYGQDGEERIIQHINRGQLLAPIVMFMPQRSYPVDTRAAVASRLCQMRRETLHKICLDYPEVSLRMLAMAGKALSSRIDDVDSLASRNASQRIAGYLLQLYEQQGQHIELPLSQRQLAATLGIRTETLNRLLAQWQKQGHLFGQRRNWRINDRSALMAIEANRCCYRSLTVQAGAFNR